MVVKEVHISEFALWRIVCECGCVAHVDTPVLESMIEQLTDKQAGVPSDLIGKDVSAWFEK